MDILLYLAELIQSNTEVGLPELGTFFKKKSPGRYDAELHSFLPPSYALNFKTEVTEDQLLSDYISKKNNISLDSAHYYRDQFIENLKLQLKEKQEADLNTIGKLIVSNDVISFQSNQDLHLGFEFYGLPLVEEEKSLVTEPEEETTLEEVIAENKLEEENPGNVPVEPIYEHPAPAPDEEPALVHAVIEAIPPIEEEQPVQPPFYKEPEYTEEPKKGTPLYLKVILGALILAILAMVVFLIKPELFDQLTRNTAHAPAPVVPLQKIPDSLSKKSDSLKMDSVKKDTVAVPLAAKITRAVKDTASKKAVVPPVPAALPEGTTYEVIGSSVYGEKEANEFIAFMKKKWGVDAKIVSHRKGKKIKISIASFKDKATADAERKRLEEKIKIPGLYVYPNTHKPE